MTGGLAQAYATMGFCTCMKTVEMTKHKAVEAGAKAPGTMATFMDIYRREGIAGINKGVNAVAVRQVTNWGSRFGLSRVAYVFPYRTQSIITQLTLIPANPVSAKSPAKKTPRSSSAYPKRFSHLRLVVVSPPGTSPLKSCVSRCRAKKTTRTGPRR